MNIDEITEIHELPLFIRNDGYRIVETNYWDKVISKIGYYYMSLNAGYYRLLVPENHDYLINEIQTAKEVVISRGPSMQFNPPIPDAFEIMFEDGSDSPYSITTPPEYWDRYPGNEDQGWNGKMAVYIKNSKKPIIEFNRVFYRCVDSLPCLAPVDG